MNALPALPSALKRRRILGWMGAAACPAIARAAEATPAEPAAAASAPSPAPPALDVAALRQGYAKRLKALLADGHLPYIDIESSCHSQKLELDDIAKALDSQHIGLMALSADIGHGQYERGVRYDPLNQRLLAAYPDRFIPVGNGGQGPCLNGDPTGFVAAQEAAARQGQLLLLGEYEFHHYPSPRQVKRGEFEREARLPIDGPTGHAVFGLASRTRLAFQLRYELEDANFPPLEKMLTQYPKARVVWCHLAQIRYEERAPHYTADYVASLIQRFPQLSFDTAFGDAMSVYPASGQRQARVWNALGGLKDEWRDLIAAHPQRFLSALDLGGDRLERIVTYDGKHRHFLAQLPKPVQEQVAYRNAWRLVFGEEFA